jgi:prepilin-type N-terminal cleavage/methylation domain-containing protein
MNRNHVSRRGFSILEIMIVLVIIGLMAGMAIVVIRKVRTRAVSVAMVNDARQIAQAIQRLESENLDIQADTPLTLTIGSDGVLSHPAVPRATGAIPADQIRAYLNRVGNGYTSPIVCVLASSANGGTAFTLSHPLVSPADVAENSTINVSTVSGGGVAFDDSGKPR